MQEAQNGEHMRQAAHMIIALSCVVIAGLLAVVVYQNSQLRSQPDITTPFKVVQMTNGQVFLGRLQGAGSAFPALRDVYLFQSKTSSETKQVTSTLIKRVKDAEGTDEIFLNAAHIQAIEPVKPGSNIDNLLQQTRSAAAAASK